MGGCGLKTRKSAIFFGNGLNRVSPDSISWDELLNTIKGENHFDDSGLPNTMVYERICLGSKMTNDEISIKKGIASALKEQKSNNLYRKVFELGCSDYLTTNYDYAFAMEISGEPIYHSTEEIYSLRRRRSFSVDKNINLWNIHGEIDHPKSIMLGLDHYCGSIGKLDAYIKGKYQLHRGKTLETVRSMKDKIVDGDFCNTSWVDLFFSSDIHIIGLSLDFSETDLWWIINKRARIGMEIDLINSIYFHAKEGECQSKMELLSSFGVKINSYELVNNNYYEMYNKMLNNIHVMIGA